MSIREYVFRFDDNVTRIPYARWDRVREGNESIKEYSNQTVYIAYAYILLKNRKPYYCPRIDGAIYYFDRLGDVIKTLPKIDMLIDLDEHNSGAIDLQYHKERCEYLKKHKWKLDPKQIGTVIDSIAWVGC